MSNKRPRTGEAETALAGFAGFGSFMQDKSVRQLISESRQPSTPLTATLTVILVVFVIVTNL